MLNKAHKVITVSENDGSASYVRKGIEANGKKCEISVLDGERKAIFTLCTTLLGTHNAINMLCACAVAIELGASTRECYLGILGVHPNGRSKVLYSNDKRLCIVVDYAHNEMSLTAMSKMAREQLGAKTVTAVFGCPGDKAQCRRYGLALACQKNVDNVIICEDDSGAEGYENIKKEMAVCFEMVKNDVALQNKKLNVAYVESRAQALLAAIENALKNEGEVILMLGKGEEALNRGAQGYTQCESDLDIAKRMILCYDSRDNKQI
jgi:UDP-N-acetylmuramyl tripeptide synthase